MKLTIVAISFVLACNLMLLAADSPLVRRDTYFPVVLKAKISSETAKVGDVVSFRTSEGVLIGNNIVVPSGSEVLGTIDEVQRYDAPIPHSGLVIRFHEVRWPHGSVQLNAVVSSVENTTQDEKAFFRHIHNLFSSPTMLEHINIYAHIQKSPFTEFTSNQPAFALRPGIRLVLWHLDPDHEPEMMVRNPIFDVNRGWKE